MASNAKSLEQKGRYALEFWVVVIMLGALTLLVGVVLFGRITFPGGVKPDGATAKDILDYRSQILSVIITAFGAWVGAGAAYFFGHENLKVAAEGLLARAAQTNVGAARPSNHD